MRTVRKGAVRLATSLILVMIISASSPMVAASAPRASGVDMTPTGFSTEYVSSSDKSEYALLSRATPAAFPSRSSDLWIVDGMLGSQMRISSTVQNIGDLTASAFSVRFVLIHDEYGTFELLNSSAGVSTLAAGASTTATTTWTPTYSGNHSLRIDVVSTEDTDAGNDRLNGRVTIGTIYETCESGSGWTTGPGWVIDTSHNLGGSASCKIGAAGTSGQYNNLQTTYLTSPVIDMSDAHPSPTNGFGIGFFYTGSTQTNDRLLLQAVESGTTHDLMANGGLSGTVDGQPTQWLININSAAGRSVPWYPIDPAILSSSTSFRFQFSSDATGTDVGYWIDDIVMFYDQKARPEEFDLSLSGTSQASAPRLGWGDIHFTVRNDGNLTDQVSFQSEGLPADWGVQFANPSGSGLLGGAVIELEPGETRSFILKFQPPESANTGSKTGTIRVRSVLEATAVDTHSFTATVDPRYTPRWQGDLATQRCPPGQTCTFSVPLTNAGDGSDTFVLGAIPDLLPDGWSYGLSSEQSGSVTLQQGETVNVRLAVAIPSDAPSGTIARCRMTAQSQADSTSIAETTVNVTASMISSASIALDPATLPVDGTVPPGQYDDLVYTIQNDASRQDIFDISIDGVDQSEWTVEILGLAAMALSPATSGVVSVRLTAPSTALANDPAPRFEMVVVSSISGSSYRSDSFDGVRARMLHDLSASLTASPAAWTPGITDAIGFNVTNQGNGDDQVNLIIEGLPVGWNWTVRVDGVTTALPFPIGLAPADDSIRAVEVVIEPSGNAAPGTMVTTTISVIPASGTDIDEDDHVIDSVVFVERVMLPATAGFQTGYRDGVLLGSTLFEQVTVRNDGNAYDPNVRVKLMMSPLMPDLEAVMIIDGIEHGLNTWVSTPLSAQMEEVITTRLRIGGTVPIDTLVTLTLMIEGGASDSPIDVSTSITYSADELRVIEVVTDLPEELIQDVATNGDFTVEVTSRSTRDEGVFLETSVPSGWTIQCTPQNGMGAAYRLILEPPAHTGRTLDFDCEYIIGTDALNGDLTLNLVDEVGTLLWTETHSVTALRPESEPDVGFLNGLGSGKGVYLASAGLIGLLGVASILFILIRQRSRAMDDAFEVEEEEYSPHPEQAVVQTVYDLNVTQQSPAQTPYSTTPLSTEGGVYGQPPTADLFPGSPQVAAMSTDPGWHAHQPVAAGEPAAASWQEPDPTMVQQQTMTALPDPFQQQPVIPPQPSVDLLSGAFSSLGVSTAAESTETAVEQPVEPTTHAAGADASGVMAESPIDRYVQQLIEQGYSQEVAAEHAARYRGHANSAEAAPAETQPLTLVPDADTPAAADNTTAADASIATLPVIECTHCARPLGPTDVWSECHGCGGYRHQSCLIATPVCPRCHSS